MSVSRDEFDALASRVERLERQTEAMATIVAAEVVGLRSAVDTVDRKADAILAVVQEHDRRFDEIDRHFDAMDRRFDTVDAKLDAILNHLT